MPGKPNQGNSKGQGAGKQLDKLKHEVAAELHLDDDIQQRGWENMTTSEVGKIGGNMTKKMVNYAEKKMVEKDGKMKS